MTAVKGSLKDASVDIVSDAELVVAMAVAETKSEGAQVDALFPWTDAADRVGIERLVAQVELIVEESGSLTGFDPESWLKHWLNQPIGALGGKRPADYMATREGQEMVSNLLLQAQHGVFV